jgi:hypothetical protein
MNERLVVVEGPLEAEVGSWLAIGPVPLPVTIH